MHNVPLVGEVAAGTGVLAEENIEELLPMPAQFTGNGPSFMLRVRGDSMIDAGIFDGDYVVVRQQPEANNGDVVVAGINDGEATVKTFSRKSGRRRAVAGQHGLSADGVRRARRGHHLRQGRDRGAAAELGTASVAVGYLRSFDMRRSASTFPPVWQVGQYAIS